MEVRHPLSFPIRPLPIIDQAESDRLRASFQQEENTVAVGYYYAYYNGIRNGIQLEDGDALKHRFFEFLTEYGFQTETPHFNYNIMSLGTQVVTGEPTLFQAIRNRDITEFSRICEQPFKTTTFKQRFTVFDVAAFFLKDKKFYTVNIMNKIFEHFNMNDIAKALPPGTTVQHVLKSCFKLACIAGNIQFIEKLMELNLIDLTNNELFRSVWKFSPLRTVVDCIASINHVYDRIESFIGHFPVLIEKRERYIKENHVTRNPGPFDHPFSMFYIPLIEDLESDEKMYETALFLFENGVEYFI